MRPHLTQARPSRAGCLTICEEMQGSAACLGGLSELFGRFGAPLQQAKVQSWVQRGPNAPLSASEMEQALDEETIAELVAKTGLSREELLHRLSSALPEAVDQATPDGTSRDQRARTAPGIRNEGPEAPVFS